jgi:1,4-dihydroxy-2-naphthoate octaprenyltransferase
MTHPATVTRRDVWMGMLLYPRHTLPTALAPVLVATGLAVRNGVAAPAAAAAALLAGWLIQLGGVVTDNYWNLVRHGDDAEHASFVEALRQGLVTMGELRRTIAVCYAGAALAGAYLVVIGGVPVIVLGVLSVVASLAYSSGPHPLGDHALGDPLFFAFFGIVSVMGTYYVQATAAADTAFLLAPPARSLPMLALVASVPIGALTTNILVIDNIRDYDYDRAKGEHTLAGVIGRSWSLVEIAVLDVLAFAVPVALWAGSVLGPAVLLPLLALPYAAVVFTRVVTRARHPEALLPMTPQAGQVLMLYAVLFAVGLAM